MGIFEKGGLEMLDQGQTVMSHLHCDVASVVFMYALTLINMINVTSQCGPGPAYLQPSLFKDP